jgi:hypothetical protein
MPALALLVAFFEAALKHSEMVKLASYQPSSFLHVCG